jgi:hypothetical protein
VACDRLLPPRRLVAPNPGVQVHLAALPLNLVDLALAVVLAARLEGQQLSVLRQPLEASKQVSYCHALSVAASAQSVRVDQGPC